MKPNVHNIFAHTDSRGNRYNVAGNQICRSMWYICTMRFPLNWHSYSYHHQQYPLNSSGALKCAGRHPRERHGVGNWISRSSGEGCRAWEQGRVRPLNTVKMSRWPPFSNMMEHLPTAKDDRDRPPLHIATTLPTS